MKSSLILFAFLCALCGQSSAVESAKLRERSAKDGQVLESKVALNGSHTVNPETATEAAAVPVVKPKPGKARNEIDRMAADLKPSREVVYKKVGDRELRLHIFEPEGHQPADRRTCFITIHGGGWIAGTPQRMYPFAAHFATLGMVGISLEYRLINKTAGFDGGHGVAGSIRRNSTGVITGTPRRKWALSERGRRTTCQPCKRP